MEEFIRVSVGCRKMKHNNFLEIRTVSVTIFVSTLLLLLNLSVGQDNAPTVTVEQGQLRGVVLQSRKEENYFAYLGVPYAKKPERFEEAVFPDKWTGIKDAKDYGNVCPQFDPIGDEDCLFANIMTPNINGSLPVMVYIHGGGFQFTSGDGFGGKYWMDAGIVLVTFNYRVAALGFLSTGDGVIQGNYGLKDQTLCFKWVKQNIQSFGGDPTKITIFGESAGGASVNYHLISPMSNGLFQNAISQSGAAINPWAFQFNPLKQAQKLAKYLNCSIADTTVIKDCLKSKSAAEIVATTSLLEEWNAHPLYPFPPSVEKPSNDSKESVFLSDNPFRLMSEGKVNKNITWVTGVNEAEGIFYVGSVTNANGYPQDIKEREGRNEILPKIFFYDDSVSADSKNAVTNTIWEFYFSGSENISVANMSNFFGDRFFNFGIRETAKLYAKHGSVYPYHFTKRGNFSWGELYFGPSGLKGASHCDELYWQFNLTFGTDRAPEFDRGSDDEAFSQKFIDLWASIAKDGKPTKTWGQENWLPINISQGTLKWYKIDDVPSSIDLPFESRMKFWEDLSGKMDEWKMGGGAGGGGAGGGAGGGISNLININIIWLTFCSLSLHIANTIKLF